MIEGIDFLIGGIGVAVGAYGVRTAIVKSRRAYIAERIIEKYGDKTSLEDLIKIVAPFLDYEVTVSKRDKTEETQSNR